MVKRGTEELMMNQLSPLKEKNKMFIVLNVTTKCSTSKPGISKQHVTIRLKSLSKHPLDLKVVPDFLEKAKVRFIRFFTKHREPKVISILMSGQSTSIAN